MDYCENCGNLCKEVDPTLNPMIDIYCCLCYPQLIQHNPKVVFFPPTRRKDGDFPCVCCLKRMGADQTFGGCAQCGVAAPDCIFCTFYGWICCRCLTEGGVMHERTMAAQSRDPTYLSILKQDYEKALEKCPFHQN